MSEYYFAREGQAMPLYKVVDEFEGGAPISIFTFPSKPVPVVAKYKPMGEYNISNTLLYPEFSISKKVYSSIDLKNLFGVNWIPIKLNDKGEHDFMMLQLAHEIDVVDHENSDFKRFEDDDISGMKKLVLASKKIASIPLNQRLIFRDKAWGFHTFFHKSIVDKILSTNPSGVKFVPISDFNRS